MTMLYLMAMRVFSPREGRGVNVYLYLPTAPPKPDDVWSLADDPGPHQAGFLWREVKGPSGSSVEAFLDFILLDRADFSTDLVKAALDEVERKVEAGVPNPAKLELRVGETVVYVVFSVNLGLADLPTQSRVLGELRRAIEQWCRVYEAKLTGTRDGDPRRAAG